MNYLVRILVILVIFTGIAGTFFYKHECEEKEQRLIFLEKENEKLREKNVTLLEEHKQLLEENNVMIRRELINKYIDFMIDLRNKIDSKIILSDKDITLFFDRAEFIVENLGVLKLKKDEAKQYLEFISMIKDKIKGLPDRKNPKHMEKTKK